MTLNEKIGKILTQHEEGEDFFNALDYMIKGDRDILEDFLHFFMNDAGKRLNLNDTGLVVSGGFGNAVMTMYGERLTEVFGEVIVTNGGIRTGKEALIVELNNMMQEVKETKSDFIKGKSLRLNLFADMKLLLPEHIDLSLWNVKEMEWLENCPLPQGEDFRRIKELW